MSSEYEPLLGYAHLPPPPKVTLPTRGLPDPLDVINTKRAAQNQRGDNLVKYGGAKLGAGASKKAASDQALSQKDRLFRFCCLVFAPTLLFALTLWVVFKFWIYEPMGVWWFILAVKIILVVLYRQTYFKREWHHVTLQMMMVASIVGQLVGIVIFYRQWCYYFRYRDLRQHTNVAGTQNAAALSDAGIITFTQDTTVDTSKAVGYLSGRLGKRLCVAPVVDSTAQPTDEVNFFAVGVNCCGYRGSFTCDEAGDPEARGALLDLDPVTLSGSPLLEWIFDDWPLREEFQKALLLERSAFGTLVAPTVRFLRLVKDPVDQMNNYWRYGFWQSFAATVLYGGITAWYVISDKGGEKPTSMSGTSWRRSGHSTLARATGPV